MSRRLAVFVVLVVLAGGLAFTAYGDLPGRRVLPAGEARFDVTEVTWAQGSTLHQGDRAYDVGAGFVDARDYTGSLGDPYNPRIGKRVLVRDGRVVDPQLGGGTGRRNAFFGGWRDGSTLYALATDDYRTLLDDTVRPDPSRGTLVSCELPSGRCTELREVHRLRSFTFGTGDFGIGW